MAATPPKLPSVPSVVPGAHPPRAPAGLAPSDDTKRGPAINPRRSDYDVTNTVQVSSPDAVRLAVAQLFSETWPRAPFDAVERSFGRLVDLFAGLERGNMRLAVAGKLYSADDCSRAIDAGADMVAIGRGAILHHDFPRLAVDPGFTVRPLPASRAVLAEEGLSETFIGYMGNWPGFVGD